MTNDVAELTEVFLVAANLEKVRHFMRFFKTGEGQYGYGDQFLGLPVPATRILIKPFWGKLSLEHCDSLLDSSWHGIRLAALLLVVDAANRMQKKRDLLGLTELFDLNDRRLEQANNWDLIDLSVYNIMGAYWLCANTLADERRLFLQQWVDSGNLWRECAAMVSTWAMIRRGILDDTFWLAEHFITHPHDLIHKASGWMLREAGKKGISALRGFLAKFHTYLP